MNTNNSYWGPVTSSIDWCEPNYKYSIFIAEPANTVSNLSFVLFGIAGAIFEYSQNKKSPYTILYAVVSLIGVGSMLFHGTLTVWGQQLDELPMVWLLLMCCYSICLNDKNQSHSYVKLCSFKVLLSYGLAFSTFHMIFQTTTLFQVHFIGLIFFALTCLYNRYKDTTLGNEGLFIFSMYVASGLLGATCWLIDYHQCHSFHLHNIYPFFHVLWHICMGYNAYYSVATLKIFEMQQLCQPTRVQYIFGLPFIYVSNSTTHSSTPDLLTQQYTTQKIHTQNYFSFVSKQMFKRISSYIITVDTKKVH